MSSPTHYTATQAILDFHNLPRFGGASNVLNAQAFSVSSLAELRANTYAIGVLAPGIAIIAAGILIFIVYILAYLCACCRCCGACKPRNRPPYPCMLRSRQTAMALIACLNLALILSAISYVPGFTTGAGQITASLQAVVKNLDSAFSVLVSSGSVTYSLASGVTRTLTSVLTSMNYVTQNANNLQAQACVVTAPLYSLLCPIFTGVASSLTTIASTITSAAAPIASASSGLNSAANAIPINDYKTQINLGSIIVLAVISGFICFQSILLCGSRVAGCLFKTLSFISVILSTLVFVLAGLFYIVAVFGSDICYNPYAVSASLAGGADPTGTLSYYMSCYPSFPTPPSSSAPGIVLSSLNDLVSTSANFTTLMATPPISTSLASPLGAFYPGLNATAYFLSGNLTQGGNTLNLFMGDLLSCANVDGLISGLFNGLCGGGIASSVGIARILIAAATLLLIQLSLGVDLACYREWFGGV